MNVAFFIILTLWLISIIISNAKHYFYIGSWDNTKQSARYKMRGWWFGFNKRTKSWFLIHNGGFHFQLQNWNPRFVFKITK